MGEEKRIYIIYSNTYFRVSKILNFFLREEFTHVSISLEQDISKFYSFGRRNLYFPLIGGFVAESITEGIFSVFNETIIEVLEKEVSDKEYEFLSKELEKYKIFSRLYKYNFLGLPFIWFKVPYERERHFVCSQFVGYLLHKSGIHDFGKSWSLVLPNDIREIKGLKSIYKGKMKEFKSNKISNKGKKGWINSVISYKD